MKRAERLAKRGNEISGGRELVAHVEIVTGFADCARDGRVVDFLGIVQVAAARHTGRVEMTDMRDVIADRADEITFL